MYCCISRSSTCVMTPVHMQLLCVRVRHSCVFDRECIHFAPKKFGVCFHPFLVARFTHLGVGRKPHAPCSPGLHVSLRLTTGSERGFFEEQTIHAPGCFESGTSKAFPFRGSIAACEKDPTSRAKASSCEDILFIMLGIITFK